MSQSAPIDLAQEFLRRLQTGAAPAEVAELFSQNAQWEIAGDVGVLPWIGKKSGKKAVVDFLNDTGLMIERLGLNVQDILVSQNRAVIVGSLSSRVKQTGKISIRISGLCSLSLTVRSAAFRCWKTASRSRKQLGLQACMEG